MDQHPTRQREHAARLVVGSAFGAIAVGTLAVLLWRHHAAIVAWMREAHAVPFFAVMAFLPAVGVPSTPLYVLAGATFGIVGGLIGATLAIAGNLVLCYAIATTGLRRAIAPILHKLGYELPNLGESQRSAVRFTLAVKLAPGLPTFAKNYLLGLAGIPFWPFFGLSLGISWPLAAVSVVVGESLFDHETRRLLMVLAAAALVAFGVWRFAKRTARKTEQPA